MGVNVIAYEDEIHSSLSPEKAFKYFILDGDNIVPKAVPEAFKSIQTVLGDGGAGSIKMINYGEGLGHKTSKHQIDELDESNLSIKYSVFEGYPLDEDEGLEKIINTVKIESAPDGGSIFKSKTEVHVKEHYNLTEEKINEGKEKARGLLKAVEAHIHAHPNEYK